MTISGHAMTQGCAYQVNVFLITNNHMLMAGVKSLLSPFATVAYGKGDEQQAIRQARPHAVILDMNGDPSVLRLIPTLREIVPYAKTILLAGLGDIVSVQGACSNLDGIVLTTQPPEVLVATVHHLMLTRIERNTMPIQNDHEHSDTWHMALTEQELLIVRLVRQGLSNKEIADRVCASPNTVRHHLTSIFSKLGVADRQHLIIKTFQLRTVPSQASEEH